MGRRPPSNRCLWGEGLPLTCVHVQLLTLEGVECAYIYSALDQTARKINIGKFVHRKAMVLIVTDVAARGIDIPLLDNVINYNFPSKAKLFLHRVGEPPRMVHIQPPQGLSPTHTAVEAQRQKERPHHF